jgi:shikimate kinase
MNIVLIGFPGSGKSAVGMALARAVDMTYIDLDTCIEAIYVADTGESLGCREIFARAGAAAFAALEADALGNLDCFCDFVLSTGGRTPLNTANREALRDIGKIVYLRSGPEAIYVRMVAKGMPTFLRRDPSLHNLTALWHQRDPVYRELADVCIDNSELTIDETVRAITAVTVQGPGYGRPA